MTRHSLTHFSISSRANSLKVLSTDQSYEEKELFYLIAEGDEKAFALLYQRYVPQLAAYISTITRSDRMVNEFVQETFLRLWIGRDKLKEVEEPKAWTFRIAANICHNYLKRLLVEKKVYKRVLADSKEHADDVAETAQVNELLAALKEAVHTLSPQRKKVYRLSREEGLTIPEIAQSLDLSPNTVRNTLSGALEYIRGFLQKKGFNIPVLLILLAGW